MSFKIFSIIAAIAFVFGLGAIFVVNQFLKINPPTPTHFSLPYAQPSRIAGWDLYSDTLHLFTIQHPSDNPTSVPALQDGQDTSSPILHISTAEDSMTGGLSIGRSDDPIIGVTVYTDSDTARCFIFPASSSSTAMLFNAIAFKTASWSDAAMGGERAIIRQYRTVRNATCYILESTIHYRDVTFLSGVTGPKPHATSPAESKQQADWIDRQQATQSRIIRTFSFSR